MGGSYKPDDGRRSDGPDPLPGSVINGKYRVASVLAQGGMGKIYRAEQVPLGRPVALKVLRTRHADEAADDPQFQRRFFIEASILSKLQHNHIVTLYDYGRIEGVDGEQYFMAMEMLRGETLARRIRDRGPMPVLDAMRVVRQVAKGLNAAHKLDIVHRDLKPSNIMLVPEDDGGEVVKVLDFGIGKIMSSDAVSDDDLTVEGAFLGSPRYMAPEQVSDGKVDTRTDIYSLGVIMYELLTGKIPFDGETNIGIMMAHCNLPVPPMHQRNPAVAIPPQLEALVMHCMQKGAAMRPANMEEFLRELGACEAAISSGAYATLSSGSLPSAGPVSHVGPISAHASPSSPPPRSSSAPTGTHRSLTRSQAPGLDPEAAPSAPRSRTPIIVGAVGLVVLLGIGAELALVSRPAPAPPTNASAKVEPPARTSFTLILESTPSGAEVREGDTLLGTTPLRLPIDHASVAHDARKFIVTRAGYAPYTVYQGDSTDDLRVLAALVADAPVASATASAAPSASAPRVGAAKGPATPTTTATARANNPDLDIKLKR